MEGTSFGCVLFFSSRQQNQIERSFCRNSCLEKARGCLLKCAVPSLLMGSSDQKKVKVVKMIKDTRHVFLFCCLTALDLKSHLVPIICIT
jgi:hypothetical protein